MYIYIGLGSNYTWCNFKYCNITQYFFNWLRILKNPLYVRLYYLCIFSILAKFQGDQRLITISSINCLNSSFCN